MIFLLDLLSGKLIPSPYNRIKFSKRISSRHKRICQGVPISNSLMCVCMCACGGGGGGGVGSGGGGDGEKLVV